MNNYDSYFTIGTIALSLWLLKKYFFKPTISETKLIYIEIPSNEADLIFENKTLKKATVIIELDHRETDNFEMRFMYGEEGNYKYLSLQNHGREVIEIMPNEAISAMNYASIPIVIRLNIQYSVNEYEIIYT